MSNEIATLGTLANYAEGVDLTVNTLTVAQLWERAKTDAEKWTTATLDADRAGMQVLLNCVTLKQTHKVKKPLGSIMAQCLDTPATRKRIGVARVTTEHLTGKKGVLSEDANARYYYGVATALDVIISRGAQVDADALKNAAGKDRAAYFAAFRSLAASLKKNESVKLTGTLTQVFTQCGLTNAESIKTALKTPGSPYAALLPPPVKTEATEATDADAVDTEATDADAVDTPKADAVDTEATDADAVDTPKADAVDTLTKQAEAVDAKTTEHREREHANGTRTEDAVDGLHAALGFMALPMTPQAIADFTQAIAKAGSHNAGSRMDAVAFTRAVLAELPQQNARSIADAEPARLAAQGKTKKATK